MLQVIEQTREEKIAMYLKLTKRELAEMLANANDAIGLLSATPYIPPSYTPLPILTTTTAPYYPNNVTEGLT